MSARRTFLRSLLALVVPAPPISTPDLSEKMLFSYTREGDQVTSVETYKGWKFTKKDAEIAAYRDAIRSGFSIRNK